ncbi:UdgX family uracil-DNA binding protein [Xylophilus sp. Leaf220]|uniref:UdgX family uracil-DNA binding protein n=1 Tax=Xylophilus sp. Leaf220 TaxID=1735686 RepID=UPI0006F4F2F2|nr:UdgX family uracil-DNA binding protein [Xylophilus sp. Leaf220]KQM77377.1 hypothetical protein ASE76_18115 [Xylophilus sp. Leaf220]
MATYTVLLPSETDLTAFRAQARRLLTAGVSPEAVQWQLEGRAAGDLFAQAAPGRREAAPSPGLFDTQVSTPGLFDDAPATPGLFDAETSAPFGRPGEDDRLAVNTGQLFPEPTDPSAEEPAFEPDTSVEAASDDAPDDTDGASNAPADGPGTEPLSAARPIGTVSPALPALSAARPARAVSVPPTFLALCATVVLHADPNRFGLLYRLLWRMAHEPGLRHDPLDPDRLQAEQMAKAVRRDIHKMRAFVRFRTVADGGPAGADVPLLPTATVPLDGIDGPAPHGDGLEHLHVAWFEPLNHIVEANAPFFKRRFTQMRWAILTPQRCVAWDGRTLTFGPGARKEDAPPADAGEGLWLTYYAHIFNPARLKLKMMQKEMPRRYWPNLPEARLIGELSAQAMARSGGMIDQAATVPARRIRSVVPVVVAGHTGAASRPALQHLSELQDAANRCRACPIGAGATQAVVGEGPAHAALMVVGEQPGDHEDLRGRPFVGPAGQLFDRAVRELGWSRDRLYVTNAVKHFKYELRGTRRIHKTPHQQEVDACLHWLESELELVAPQAVLALGATAARAILGRPVAVMRERGQWHEGPQGRPVLVTLHPSALLRADPGHAAENFRHWVEDLSLATALAAG